MAYVLGLDIGTSYTAAAIHRVGADSPGGPQALRLGSRTDGVPSVVFLPEDGPMLLGEAAERRGLAQPDRMIREFKRRVGDPVPIIAGDTRVLAEDLVAAMAIWVVARAAELEGELPVAVALAHPAGWGSYKTGLIQAALERAGLPSVTLLSEPVAAARHYAGQQRIEPGSVLGVYDFGGGTFDVAILRTEADGGFTLLGAPDGLEELGGRDFDDAVFQHVLRALGDRFDDLDPDDPEAGVALARLRRECVESKEGLSFDSEATVPVLLPGLATQVRLLRSEFEGLIEDRVQETIAALAAAADAAGVGVDGLSTVLLVGGSSRIPLVAELISAELGRPVAIDVDPKAAIALGTAAFAAAQVAPVFPVAAAEVEPLARPDASGEAIAVPLGSRAARVRILLTAAATVAALLVLAGPASPIAPSTGPFATGGVRPAAAGGAAEAAAADTADADQEAPAAVPVESGDPTPDLIAAPAPRSELVPPPRNSSAGAARPATGTPSSGATAGTIPASNPGNGSAPVTTTQDPGTSTPVEEPPAQPPVEEPPAEQPPVEEPPAEQPPVEEPPAEQPPVEEPPAEEPPAGGDAPPVDDPANPPLDPAPGGDQAGPEGQG